MAQDRRRCKRCGGMFERGREGHYDCQPRRSLDPKQPRTLSLTQSAWAKLEWVAQALGLRTRSEAARHVIESFEVGTETGSELED